jgi:hypothetical protein
MPYALPMEMHALDKLDKKKACDIAEEYYRGIAAALGFDCDMATATAESLFYLPSRRRDATPVALVFDRPQLLDWRDFERVAKPQKSKGAKGEASDTPAKARVGDYIFGDFDLVLWNRDNRETFRIADHVDPSRGADKYELESCPFSDMHSAGAGGAAVANPGSNGKPNWFAGCRHQSCRDRHQLAFLLAWLKDGTIDAADLKFGPKHRANALVEGGKGRLDWPDTDDKTKPRPNSLQNVAALVDYVNAELRHNEFTSVDEVRRNESSWREIDEEVLNDFWAIAQQLGLPVKFDSFARLLSVVAKRNRYHPVLVYLQSLKWDGIPRLETWMTKYLGVADSPLMQAFGRITLCGAVRRVLYPGCKHDTLLVLEGPQGSLKSSAVAVLGGTFAGDGLRIGLDAKVTIEQTHGLWIIEIAELAGMQNREVEQIKDMLSRPTDRARKAFGRLTSTVPRQWLAIGTTNSDTYLRDRTGNRRFLPVKIGKVDIEALKRDRDQLWAEAYVLVDWGAGSELPARLWAEAAMAQDQRLVIGPIEERLSDLIGDLTGRVAKDTLWRMLGRKNAADRTLSEANIMTEAMKRLGWTPEQQRDPSDSGKRKECYSKLVPGEEPQWLQASGSDELIGHLDQRRQWAADAAADGTVVDGHGLFDYGDGKVAPKPAPVMPVQPAVKEHYDFG